MKKDRTVICHCHAGLGRTGLFGASVLVYSGYSGEEAIRMVREARKGTIEKKVQEEFIKNLEFD